MCVQDQFGLHSDFQAKPWPLSAVHRVQSTECLPGTQKALGFLPRTTQASSADTHLQS